MDNALKEAVQSVVWLLINLFGLMGLVLMLTLFVSIPMLAGATPPQILTDASVLWSDDYIFAYCITFPCAFLMIRGVFSHRKQKTN